MRPSPTTLSNLLDMYPKDLQESFIDQDISDKSPSDESDATASDTFPSRLLPYHGLDEWLHESCSVSCCPIVRSVRRRRMSPL